MKIIPLLLALGLGVGGFVVPSVPAAPQEGDVRIVAAPASAGVLRPGLPLLVTGTISNDTGRTLDAGTATVHVSSSKMVTRTALARWLSEDTTVAESPTGDPLGEVRIGELAVGQSRSFSITVPAASLAFINGATGVYPLEIRLTADQLSLATRRSAISWLPEGPQMSLAIVTPLSTRGSMNGLLDAEALTALTSPGGSLDDQLTTAMSHPVAIGVDPMIVASIRVLGDSAPQPALDWLQRLDRLQNDVFALTYADSDQLLLRQAGATAPVEPTSFPHQDTVTPSPTESASPGDSTDLAAIDADPIPGSPLSMRTTIDGLSWPGRALTSEDDLEFLSTGGSSRTLLSSTDVTGSALSTPNVMVGEHKTTVSDARVSAALSVATSASTESEWASAAANLTAELTATAAQSPGATLVATVSRASASNSRMVDSTLTAIQSLGLARPITLRNAFEIAPVTGAIPDSTIDDGALERVPLTTDLLASEVSLARFSSVVDDPTLVTGPQRLDLLALASATWASDFPAWAEAVREQLALNDEMLSSVHLPESSSITFLQEKGNLPIAVRNELSFPVTVYVTVRPERAILTVSDNWVKLSIEPNSQAKASVPVESIANGEVRTTVTLSSATGVAISQPGAIILNVQAGWETTATVVLAIIVFVLFGAGVWRTVLRRRSLRTAATESKQKELS